MDLSKLLQVEAQKSNPNQKKVEQNRYGFKGFEKGLICRRFVYKPGETYVHDSKIKLCSNGFHFCYRISDVFSHYRKDFERHEFAIVEPLGELLVGSDKAVTNKLKIHRILTPDEVEKLIEREKSIEEDIDIFSLDIIRELQKTYNFAIGGSCALFLQGLTLDRKKGQCDLDIIMPYYQKFVSGGEILSEVEEFNGKGSGNDYAHTCALTTKDGRFLKMDIKVKPEQPYKIVNYKGNDYKVCDIFTILAAKIKYAQEGNKKHEDDVMSLLSFDLNFNKDKVIPEHLQEDYVFNFFGINKFEDTFEVKLQKLKEAEDLLVAQVENTLKELDEED